MAFKFEGKEMYPIFVFAKCCWSIHSKAWQERAQQTEKCNSHTNSAVSRQVYVHASSASIQCILFFSFCFIKNVQLTVQVCCLFYFLLHGTFFKGKVRSGIFGGFYCFF